MYIIIHSGCVNAACNWSSFQPCSPNTATWFVSSQFSCLHYWPKSNVYDRLRTQGLVAREQVVCSELLYQLLLVNKGFHISHILNVIRNKSD